MKVLSVIGFMIVMAPLRLAAQAPAPCTPEGNVQFICGQQAPEDLVVIPGSEWVAASAFAGNGGVRLINTRDRNSIVGYPSATSKDKLDAKTYNTCSGPPDDAEKARFATHG